MDVPLRASGLENTKAGGSRELPGAIHLGGGSLQPGRMNVVLRCRTTERGVRSGSRLLPHVSARPDFGSNLAASFVTYQSGSPPGFLCAIRFGLPTPFNQLLFHVAKTFLERIERIARRKILLHHKPLATDLLRF